MKLLSLVMSCVMLSFIAGCVTPAQNQPAPKQNVPFDDAAFEGFTKSGTGAVIGSAFLKTRGGDVKVGAGCVVELMPLVPYTRERYERVLLRGERLEARDPRLARYVRKTVADAQGRFEFSELAPGEYVAVCQIQWEYFDGAVRQVTGGQAFGLVTVKEGVTEKFVVTR